MIYIKEKLLQFKNMLKVITNLEYETRFTFTPTEIYVSVINTSNIAMIITTINKSLFEKYEIKKEATYTVDNDTLTKIVNRVGKKELSINIKPEGMIFSNSNNDEYTLKYYVSRNDERPTPKIYYKIKWKLKPGELINSLGEAIEFSNTGIFKGKDQLVVAIKAHLIKGETIIPAERIDGEGCESYYDMGEFIYISSIRNIFDSVLFYYDESKCCMEAENDDIKFKYKSSLQPCQDKKLLGSFGREKQNKNLF